MQKGLRSCGTEKRRLAEENAVVEKLVVYLNDADVTWRSQEGYQQSSRRTSSCTLTPRGLWLVQIMALLLTRRHPLFFLCETMSL